METSALISSVLLVIEEFYIKDIDLVRKNLCERCLVFRLGLYLDKAFPDYYVDCEFNKSFYKGKVGPKILSNIHGNYVDIIVHKRSNNWGENLMCFEVKKANNTHDQYKDGENLRILTRQDIFCYLLGFYIILGKSYESTRLEIFSKGNLVESIPILRQHGFEHK